MTTSEQRPIGKLLPTRFVWKVDNFSKLGKECRSDVFVIGGCRWYLEMYPKGQQRDPSSLALFLCIADSSTQPAGWSVVAQFSLTVIDQINKNSITKSSAEDTFTASHDSWGFASLMPLADLRSPDKGYLINDACMVEVGVSVRKVVGYRTFDDDSKQEASGRPVDAAAPAQKTGVDEKPESRAAHTVPPVGLLPAKIPQHSRSMSLSGFIKEEDGYSYGSEREAKELAYHFVLQSLYMQGDHKWKNEVWLTELRGALGISNDDHIMHLKRVLYGDQYIPESRRVKD